MLSGLGAQLRQIAIDLQQQGNQPIQQELLQIKMKSDNWIAKAQAYVNFQNTNLQGTMKAIQLSASAEEMLNNRQSSQQHIAKVNAYEKLYKMKNNIMDRAILFEGYKIINDFGVAFRGKPLEYMITIQTTGNLMSSQGSMLSWTVDHSEFEKLITTQSIWKGSDYSSRTQLRLVSYDKIQEILGTATATQWSDNAVKAFQTMATFIRTDDRRGRRIIAEKKGKALNERTGLINYGNILEAFLDMYSQENDETLLEQMANFNTLPRSIQNQLRKKMTKTVNRTLRNTQSFAAGGDLNDINANLLSSLLSGDNVKGMSELADIQIKGMNASITNLSSMIRVMTITSDNVTSILQQIRAKSQIPPNGIDEALAGIEVNLQKAIDNLMKTYGFS